jgi:hypothetical protein
MPRELWSAAEDAELRLAVALRGPFQWHRIAAEVSGDRKACQCNARWNNYLRPGIDLSPFTAAEDDAIARGVERHGTVWRRIVAMLPARTAHGIKNRWQAIQSRAAAAEKKKLTPKSTHAPPPPTVTARRQRGPAAAVVGLAPPSRCASLGHAAPPALRVAPLSVPGYHRPAGVFQISLATSAPEAAGSHDFAFPSWPPPSRPATGLVMIATASGSSQPMAAFDGRACEANVWFAGLTTAPTREPAVARMYSLPPPTGAAAAYGAYGHRDPRPQLWPSAGGSASAATTAWELPFTMAPCAHAPLFSNLCKSPATMKTPNAVSYGGHGGAPLLSNISLDSMADVDVKCTVGPSTAPIIDCDDESLLFLSSVELIELIDIVSMTYC